jgi:hypothetical protein
VLSLLSTLMTGRDPPERGIGAREGIPTNPGQIDEHSYTVGEDVNFGCGIMSPSNRDFRNL